MDSASLVKVVHYISTQQLELVSCSRLNDQGLSTVTARNVCTIVDRGYVVPNWKNFEGANR